MEEFDSLHDTRIFRVKYYEMMNDILVMTDCSIETYIVACSRLTKTGTSKHIFKSVLELICG